MKKRLLVLAVVAAMAFVLVGCSGGANEEEQVENEPATAQVSDATPAPLEVLESGYYEDEGYIYYAVVFENPNDSWLANYPSVTVTGYDEDDAVVFSQDETCSVLFPGQKAYITNLADGSGVDRVEVEPSMSDDDWQREVDVSGAEVEALLEISDQKVTKDEYGGATVTGKVTSSYDEQLSSVRIDAILRDEDGEILGGDYTFIDNLDAGKTKAFEMNIYDLPKGFDEVEIHASY